MSYKIIAADFLQCEPRIFSHYSGEKRLQNIFLSDEDFYSVIAIDTLGLKQYSASPSDPNFLKKLAPDMRQVSKVFCFTESTMVTIKGKGLVSIKYAEIGDEVLTSSGYKRITNLFNRKTEVIRVISNKGFFKSTKDHPFWSETSKSWVDAGNLVKGDKLEFTQVAVPDTHIYPEVPVWANSKYKNGATHPIASIKVDEDWSWILGAFLGDGVGSYTRRKNVTNQNRYHNSHLISAYVGICGMKKDGVVKRFSKFMKDRGYVPHTKVRHEGKNNEFQHHIIADFELVKIFQDTFNLIGERTEGSSTGRKNLRVPEFIFNSPVSNRLALLAGLFDTDGYMKSNVTKTTSDAMFCSKSQDLISDVSNLLNGMSISHTMRAEWNSEYNKDYFTIYITQAGIYKLAQLGIHKHMTIPRKIQAFEDRLKVSPRVTVQDPVVLKIIDNKEVEEVYDITVDGVHEFIANGIRVHNCLAIPYGAEGFQIAAQLGYMKQTQRGERVDTERGEALVSKYLRAYPNLHKYMIRQELFAKKHGYVVNLFGRVRQIPEAKALYDQYGDNLLDSQWAKAKKLDMLRKDYKSALNVAKNSPIQGTAADVLNMGMIELSNHLRTSRLNATIRLNIHDELICVAHDRCAEQVARKLEHYMCNNRYALMLDVKLDAKANIGNNLAEVK